MNYLAHVYLSGQNKMIQIGNFIADSIKGHDYESYPEDIKNGIILHRSIDSFTDFHPIFRNSKHRLHEPYGHYSGVIMDIFYDHFLAKNWNQYSKIPLNTFVSDFYQLLNDNFSVLPIKIQKMTPIMIEQNWLESYATIEGIEKTLFRMDYRTKFKSKMQFAPKELKAFYPQFEEEFMAFFSEVSKMVEEKISNF